MAIPSPLSFNPDALRKAREWMDAHTPSLGGALSFLGPLGGAAANGVSQPDVLNDPATLERMKRYLPRDPSADGLPAPPSAASMPAPAAPPLPPPTNVGSGGNVAAAPDAWLGPHSVGGAPLPGAVSDGSFNNIDAQASEPSYDIGARMRQAGGMFRDAPEDPNKTNPGGYNNPTFGPSNQANGPDLIQKFMSYLHAKPRG